MKQSDQQPTPAAQAQRERWLWRLVSCFRALGFRLGWRYWKLQQRAIAAPDLPLYWAFQCKVEANLCEWSGYDRMANALRGWASELEAHHEKHKAANTKMSQPGGQAHE